jgi:chorismate lyase/3-hydroxybenzoate synthase
MRHPRSPSALATSPVQLPGRVSFGAPAAGIHWTQSDASLHVALPVLAGPPSQELLVEAGPPTEEDGCVIFRGGDSLAGFAVAPAELDLEAAARELYRRLFAVTDGLSLQRIWNYVPHINAAHAGLENYRRFCRGRSLAFEAHFGREFQRKLPSASAVGALAGPLAIAFLAGDDATKHFENPQQVPAFEYPPAYGPRPPSFARATLVTNETGRHLYISGTAAIRGHSTISAGDLAGQLACTHENLRRIAETAGAGNAVGGTGEWQRHFNAYVRHDTDLLHVKTYLERHLLRPGDEIAYLQADLCRAELLVEIEAVLTAR